MSSSSPCDLTIQFIREPNMADVIRIEARDGPKLLTRLELEPAKFLEALMDGAKVTAAIEE